MNELLTICVSAFTLGVLHSLEPGHCKTALAGVLLTSKNPWRDPIRLGLASALGHTIGTFFWSSLSATFFHEISKGHIVKNIETAVGGIIIIIGLLQLLKAQKGHPVNCCCGKHKKTTKKDYALPGIGFLIGLIPCPSVLAIALSAVKFQSLLDILWIAISFSSGVAISIVTAGVIIAQSAKKISDFPIFHKLSNWSTYLTPAIFILIGLFMMSHLTSHLHHHM